MTTVPGRSLQVAISLLLVRSGGKQDFSTDMPMGWTGAVGGGKKLSKWITPPLRPSLSGAAFSIDGSTASKPGTEPQDQRTRVRSLPLERWVLIRFMRAFTLAEKSGRPGLAPTEWRERLVVG